MYECLLLGISCVGYYNLTHALEYLDSNKEHNNGK